MIGDCSYCNHSIAKTVLHSMREELTNSQLVELGK